MGDGVVVASDFFADFVSVVVSWVECDYVVCDVGVAFFCVDSMDADVHIV